MKKTAALLALLLALGLSGCASQTDTPQATTMPEVTASTPPQEEVVEGQTISITFDGWDVPDEELISVTREGSYSGDMINGIPNGQGTFITENDAGVKWTYTGEFKNGTFDGYGEKVWEDGSRVEAGTFINGVFTPNTYEFFNSIGGYLSAPFDFSSANTEFILNHLDIFPAVTEETRQKAAEFINPEITYPMMTKTLDGLEGQLYQCDDAVVLQVMQESIYGHDFTIIIAYDSELNYYYICYDGVLPDVYDDTPISFTALPISTSGYSNVGGGTTNVIVLLGSTVDVAE